MRDLPIAEHGMEAYPPHNSYRDLAGENERLRDEVEQWKRIGMERNRMIVDLREALAELVRLKDGPRDDAYRAAKDAAWDEARRALGR